jgi:hypothetical protein
MPKKKKQTGLFSLDDSREFAFWLSPVCQEWFPISTSGWHDVSDTKARERRVTLGK